MPAMMKKVLLGTAPITIGSLSWRRPIVVAVVTAALTAFAIWYGEPAMAFPLAIGSLFTGIGGIGEAPGHRWRIMLWTGLWVGLAAILGGFMSNIGLAELAVVAVLAAGCGFAGTLGSRGVIVGVLTLVTYAIFAGTPDTEVGSLEAGALVGLGALVQMAALLIPVLVRNRHLIRGREDDLPSMRSRIRAHAQRRDDFARHGARLAVAMVIASAIGHTSNWPHQYWIPMTVAWLSRPDTSGMATRVLSRVAGTIIGVALAVVLIDGLNINGYGIAVVVGVGALVMLVFLAADYTIAVAGITVIVMSLFSLIGEPVAETAPSRIASTLVAAVIVVLASAALPAKSARHAVFD